jgi:hypothetical protein
LKIIAALLALVVLCASAHAQTPPAAVVGKPVAGAPRWKLLEATDGCWAETGAGAVFAEGDTVHAKILINKSGELVLVAARPEWQRTETRIDFTVAVDGGEPIPMSGSAAVVMAMAPVKNSDVMNRLRAASALSWNLPWGDYKAQVAGFGKAMDAVIACQRKRPTTPPAR